MLLPSERARLAACNGDCSCEACSKKVASDVSRDAVLVATKVNAERMNGELIAAGTVVKVLSTVTGNRAWVVEKSGNRWTHEDDCILIDLSNYRRLVDVQFSGVKGFMNLSGFDGNGKRVAGPVMFDPETNAVRLSNNFRKLADLVEEIAADPKVATVVVGVS